MERRQSHLTSRLVLLFVKIDRDPAAIVLDSAGAVVADHHRDPLAEAGERFVDGIVDHLEDQVVKPLRIRGTDIHAGPAPDRLEPGKHRDTARVVDRSARAVVVAMREGGAGALTVANRTEAKARALTDVGGDDLPVDVSALDPASPSLRAAMDAASLVVNSTSLGMRHGPDEEATPLPAELFHSGQAAFDLVYAPERTPFLGAAEQGGARPIGGLAMLIHQGAEAFRLWTGQEPPLDVMFAAVRDSLSEG